MATREGTRASIEFVCICIVPDFCKSPTIVVPYKIYSKFDCAVNFSTTVRFRTRNVFRHNSRLSTVLLDEPGVGGGVLSGVNKGFCRPIDGTASTTVRVNSSFVDYHEGTYMWMNCAGPEGPFNTIGRVKFLGNLLPGPVTPSGKIPKGCICGDSGILSDIQSSLGDVDDLIKKGKMLYALAKTDWSNPSAVLGALGGLAGIAGLQETAGLLGKAKDLYDKGKKLLNTDWSDPMQALASVASVAGVAGMDDVAQVAGIANTIIGVAKTDWSNPQAALASVTNIMKSTGLNKMVAEMVSNAVLENNIPVSQNGTLPPFFPKPGTGAGANSGAGNGSGSSGGSSSSNSSNGSTSKPGIPPSPDGLPREYITQDVLDNLKESNPVAYDRLTASPIQADAFVEFQKPIKDSNGNEYSNYDRAAIYIPGEGFSTSKAEMDGIPNVSGLFPDSISNGFKEVFVASKDSPSIGSFFGIKEKEGNAYLFGGLVDLGSPGMPGAGTASTWWVPDRILNANMSPYYDAHDKGYYGSNVTLSDLGTILKHELDAFKAGATTSPLQLPLQAIYSAATTGVGLGNATKNSIANLFGGTPEQAEASPASQSRPGIKTGVFDSVKDFYSSVFGPSSVNPQNPNIMNIAPGGCMKDVPTLPGQSAPGTGSGAPGSGAPPAKGKAGAPDGNASGAGKDGVLITTKQGNPTAELAALDAQFKAENKQVLEKAQAEERARQEQAAKEKAAKEKAEKEKAEKEKAEKEKAEKEKAESQDEEKRRRLAETAAKDAEKRRTDYSQDVDKDGNRGSKLFGLIPGGNKCSQYVHDKLEEVGFGSPDRFCGRIDKNDGVPSCGPTVQEMSNGRMSDGTDLSQILPKTSTPKPGDVVLFPFGSQGGPNATGHTGIVTSFDPETKTGTYSGAGHDDVHQNPFNLENGEDNGFGDIKPEFIRPTSPIR
ncbi:MAG: PAAR-like domain-containing protein [Pirellulaceae bacterium]|nr:PAAR-like domain-containing protein [Pirellulaceae bacterium]